MTPGDDVLQLPRRLAIQLLAHAQQLPAGEPLRGVLYGSAPAALRFRPGEPPADAPVWAWVCAQPASGNPAPGPVGVPRVLTVGLDTKGVLQLRCWDVQAAGLRERELRISG